MLTKKAIVVAAGVTLLIAGVVTWQTIILSPTNSYAAAPESCFDFDVSTGTITHYYYEEGDDYTNPACPYAVDIPQTIGGVAVTAIGNNTFAYRNITSVTIPNSVTSIGDYAFYDNYLSAVTIPGGVTSIGEAAFGNNKLSSINIPNSVSEIQRIAFYNNQLTSVTIPASVTIMEELAFANNSITSFTFLGKPSSIGRDVLAKNPVTSITSDGTTYATNQPTLPIPTQCFEHTSSTLLNYRYMDLGLLVNNGTACFSSAVDIPQSLDGCVIDNIYYGAFLSKGLTSVTIPSSVTSIGNSAFAGNNLSSITIPSSVTNIGEGTFAGNQLTTLTIPNSVTSIGTHTFSYNHLTSVIIPNSVTSIGNYAFYTNQLPSITLPSSATSLGDYAFAINPLTSVTLPNGITSIADGLFSQNQLTSITIPDSVTSIGNNAFYDNQLTSFTIPNSVTSIGDGVLTNNPIESITHKGTAYSTSQPTLPIPAQCFDHTANTLTNYRYMDLGHLVSTGTACFSKAVDIPQSLEGDTITRIGEAAFTGKNLTAITIPNSVTYIESSAFRNNKLTTVTIPNSVTNIDWNAFSLNMISHLVIPDTVTNIEAYAFKENQLTSLTLGCGIHSISQELFAINRLTEVTIPNCITSIDPTAFFGQNPWGGVVDNQEDPAHDWYSNDLNVKKLIHDNIWYVRLYTADPSNPNHLGDGVADESWYTADLNGDNDETDSIGGHLINPASISIKYVDEAGNNLAADSYSTGRLLDGSLLTDYLVKNIQTPGIGDAQNPTPEEQTALKLALNPYYRRGQSISLSAAPTINSYTLQHPALPYNPSLSNAQNVFSFTYAIPATSNKPTITSPTTEGNGASTTDTPAKSVMQPTAGDTSGANSVTMPDTTASITEVDFSAPVGSAANPTSHTVPNGLAAVMTKSTFATDDTKPCHQIDTAKLLPAATFGSSNTQQTTLGGLSFTLNCQKTGGDAVVTFTLGGTISDLTKVKVYKLDAHGVSTDVTDQISLSNQSGNGHTTISYALTDGGSLDDDGQANSSISDPIYITEEQATSPSSTANITNTTTKTIPWLTIILIVGGVAVITAAVTIVVRRRR